MTQLTEALAALVRSPEADKFRHEACHGLVGLPYANNRYVRLLDAARALLDAQHITEDAGGRAAILSMHSGTHLCMDASDRGSNWYGLHEGQQTCPVVALLSPDPERCPHCGGLNGSHGFVHQRFPQGGGGTNLPCPEAPPCASCGEPSIHRIILRGDPTPVCLRHLNVWHDPSPDPEPGQEES